MKTCLYMISVTDSSKSRRRSPKPLVTKPLVILATAVVALLIAGCGGDDETTTTAASTPTETTTPTTTTDGGEGNSGKGKGNSDGDSEAKEPEVVKQADAPPVEAIGAPKAPKGGDDSIHNFGKEASEADLRGASAVLNGYLQARVKQDWDLSCAYMSDAMISQLTQLMQQNPEAAAEDMDCGEVVEGLSAHLDKKSRQRMADIQIGAARVEDDRAFVLYKQAGMGWVFMPMIREDGEWRVTAIAGSALP